MPDTVLPEIVAASSLRWHGVVRHLHLDGCGDRSRCRQCRELVAGGRARGGRAIDTELGRETGFYSKLPEDGRQITLFEIETLWALARDHDIAFTPEEHRRNVTVEGVPLNHLVGRQFWLGATLLEATRLSTPCRHIEEVTGKTVFKPLINRSGLNCRILEGGIGTGWRSPCGTSAMKVAPITTIKTVVDTASRTRGTGHQAVYAGRSRSLGTAAVSARRAYRPASAGWHGADLFALQRPGRQHALSSSRSSASVTGAAARRNCTMRSRSATSSACRCRAAASSWTRTSTRFTFVAGGIGVTPFLSAAASSDTNRRRQTSRCI